MGGVTCISFPNSLLGSRVGTSVSSIIVAETTKQLRRLGEQHSNWLYSLLSSKFAGQYRIPADKRISWRWKGKCSSLAVVRNEKFDLRSFQTMTVKHCTCGFSNNAFTSGSLQHADTVSDSGMAFKGNREEHGLETILIYNTMSKQKEVFKPKTPGKVSMYVCGVTAYDYSHIGHARVYVAFDVLFRYLQSLGYNVTYVRNFTDVDDKIIKRANDIGMDPIELSDKYCKEFNIDMDLLRCLPPSAEPRVSAYIDKIIEMIMQILENGYGYVLEDGDVLFSVEKYPKYGVLSGRKLDENRAGERVAIDERKRNPADFALWKGSKLGEPSWQSPWGPGRPGWHIECSAMSAALLGHSFDIHGGGMDLIFPHHENEIAQSGAACTKSDISYWMHNGFVTIDKEKMSKSLGNFFTIREVLELYHPLALRWFLLGTHYRSPINYSKSQLENASDRIFYLYQTLEDCETCLAQANKNEDPASIAVLECLKNFRSGFSSAMADDLSTPIVIAGLSEPLKILNDLLHSRKGRKDKSRFKSVKILYEELKNVLNVLGLDIKNYSEILEEIKTKALRRAGLSQDELLEYISERAAARASKDYARSDQIREQLAALGISLMDGGDGTMWRPIAVSSS